MRQIKEIRDYYGEKIALYFSFLQHLLHLGYGLPLPALLGIAVHVRVGFWDVLG